MAVLGVKGYKDLYSVYDDGRIYSHISNKFLKGRIQKGYLYVILYKNNKNKGFSIHRLVALHFIANPKNKPVVNHKDGNKLNNHKDNLEWNTEVENTNHSWSMGLSKYTHSQKRSIETSKACRRFSSEEQVIKKRVEKGELQKDIAKELKVSRHTILRIVNNQHKYKNQTLL